MPYLIFGLFLWFIAKRSAKKMNSNVGKAEAQDEPWEIQLPTKAPDVQVPERHHRTNPASEKTQQYQRAPWSDQRIQTVFMGLIFLVTAGYALVSYFQWTTMKDSLRMSQRAYIVPTEIKLDFGSRQMQVALENFGHVPADRTKAEIIVEYLDFDNPTATRVTGLGYFSNDRGYERSTTILPGTYKTVASFSLANLTPELSDRIRHGQGKLQVGCFLHYEDGFGNAEEHVLNFRYIPYPNEGWESMSLFSAKEWQEMESKKGNWEHQDADSPRPSP